jgi:redox-sensing transcriptional repressor
VGHQLAKALRDLKSIRREGTVARLSRRVLRRLPAYLVALQALAAEGEEYVASAELAMCVGASPALVRKDLATIGHLGRRNAGYRVDLLGESLRRAAGLARPRQVAWFGCQRLAAYPRLIDDFAAAGCTVSAAFCSEGEHVGHQVGGLVIQPVDRLAAVTREMGLTVAVIAVDDDHAQAAAKIAVTGGIRYIVNLTNQILLQPRGAKIENVSPLQGLVSVLLRAPGETLKRRKANRQAPRAVSRGLTRRGGGRRTTSQLS